MALALATSVATRVMRRISSSVTIGLLAKPQTPLWITRTPNPAASLLPAPAPALPPPNPPKPPRPPPRPPPPRPPRPPPPNPPRSSASRLPPFAFTPRLVLRVNRMSAYVHPPRRASSSATSDRPLNFDSSTRPDGDCAIRSAITSLAATAIPDSAMVLTKSRRFMKCDPCLQILLPGYEIAGSHDVLLECGFRCLCRRTVSFQTAGDTDVIRKSSMRTGGTSAVPGPSYDSPVWIGTDRPIAVTLL